MSFNHSHIIPATSAAAVETALQKAFGSAVVTEISLLSGGLSGASTYKIVVNNLPYVLKISQPAAIPANAHATNLSLVAAAGIAPPLRYQDTLNGISISDLIINQPLRSVFAPDKLTNELATIVKAIHAITAVAGGQDLFETVDAVIGQFKQIGMLAGPVFDECFANYETLKACTPRTDADKVFSHNDLNPSNILCDGKMIWIIDWDAAHSNDRYVDLANLANFFVHTEEQESVFLNLYFDRGANEYEKARFFTMRQVCRIIYSMLMFQLAGQSKPAGYPHNQEMEEVDLKAVFALIGTGELSLASYDGQLMYGKALLNAAVHQMRTPRWASSLAQFASFD